MSITRSRDSDLPDGIEPPVTHQYLYLILSSRCTQGFWEGRARAISLLATLTEKRAQLARARSGRGKKTSSFFSSFASPHPSGTSGAYLSRFGRGAWPIMASDGGCGFAAILIRFPQTQIYL